MAILKALPGILLFNAHSLRSVAERRAIIPGILIFCLGFLSYFYVRVSVYAVLPEIARREGLLDAVWDLNLIQTLLFLLPVYIPAIIFLGTLVSGFGAVLPIPRNEYETHAAVVLPVWGLISLIAAPLQWLIPHFLVVGIIEISVGMLIRLVLTGIYTVWVINQLGRFTAGQAVGVFALSLMTLPVYYVIASWPPAPAIVAAIVLLWLLWRRQRHS